MFPDINTGDVIVVDGTKYLVVLRMPDSIALRGLGPEEDRAIVLDFEDVELLLKEDLIQVEGHLRPIVVAPVAADEFGRPMFEAFIRLENLGLAERSDNGLQQVMPILLEVRIRHGANDPNETFGPSPSEFSDGLSEFVIREYRAGRDPYPPTRGLPEHDRRASRIVGDRTVARLHARGSIANALFDDLRREAVGLLERPAGDGPHTPIAARIAEIVGGFGRSGPAPSEPLD